MINSGDMLLLQKDSGDMLLLQKDWWHVMLQKEKLGRKYQPYVIMYFSNVKTS